MSEKLKLKLQNIGDKTLIVYLPNGYIDNNPQFRDFFEKNFCYVGMRYYDELIQIDYHISRNGTIEDVGYDFPDMNNFDKEVLKRYNKKIESNEIDVDFFSFLETYSDWTKYISDYGEMYNNYYIEGSRVGYVMEHSDDESEEISIIFDVFSSCK